MTILRARLATLTVALLATSPASAFAADVNVRVQPPLPLIERAALGQLLNFDLVVSNEGKGDLRLSEMVADIRDPAGALISRLHLNKNGMIPAIETIPNRTVAPGKAQTLYNPFHTLPAAYRIGRMDYRLTFEREGGAKETASITVRPADYRPKTKLTLPVKGKMIVSDGHDLYAHHRRVDFSDETLQFLGLTANPTRYAFDFRPLNADDEPVRGDPKVNGNWAGFGQPIFAPGPGRVIRIEDRMPDDGSVDMEAIEKRKDAMATFGNFIVIDHGNGEFSHLAHIQRGSARVKAGDRVVAGQQLARIGNSGSSLSPHLHYQLISTPDLSGEGLPAYFDGYRQRLGSRVVTIPRGAPASGDILIGG